MAQSGNYAQSQFNLATQAHRQPGSTFKAIVLADALAHGIDPFTTTYLSHTLARLADRLPDLHGLDRRRRQPRRAAEPRRGARRLRQHRVRPARRRPDRGSVTKMAYALGCAHAPGQLPGGGARRPDLRRDAARDGQRLLDDRRRRLPQQADHDHQGRLPERPRRFELGQAAPRRRCCPQPRPPSRRRSSSTTSSTARRRSRRSAARARRRPARPAASSTPGSTASRRAARRSSGWAIRRPTSR